VRGKSIFNIFCFVDWAYNGAVLYRPLKVSDLGNQSSAAI
jgi:hypothetical protein